MSNASANSSEKIKIVMGPFSAVLNDKEYVLKMDPEYAKTYTEQMTELAIPVKSYTKTFDENGKIIARIDDKTGKNLNEKGIKDAIKKANELEK